MSKKPRLSYLRQRCIFQTRNYPNMRIVVPIPQIVLNIKIALTIKKKKKTTTVNKERERERKKGEEMLRTQIDTQSAEEKQHESLASVDKPPTQA